MIKLSIIHVRWKTFKMAIVLLSLFRHNGPLLALRLKHNGDRVGSLATVRCKPRQVRKEATVAVVPCAGMWLMRLPPIQILLF